MPAINITGTQSLNLPLPNLTTNPANFSAYIVRAKPTETPTRAEKKAANDGAWSFEVMDCWSYLNDTWMLILFNDAKVHTFSVRGGPTLRSDVPYTHVHTVGAPMLSNISNDDTAAEKKKIEGSTPCGEVTPEQLKKLQEMFYETEAGPNQYFLCRLLVKLLAAKIGGVTHEMIIEMSTNALYTDAEFAERERGLHPFDIEHALLWDKEPGEQLPAVCPRDRAVYP